MKVNRIGLLVIASFVFFSFNAFAQDRWTGLSLIDSSWTSSDNWSAGVPGAGADVVVDDASLRDTVDLATAAAIGNLTIDGSMMLNLNDGARLNVGGDEIIGAAAWGTLVQNSGSENLVAGNVFVDSIYMSSNGEYNMNGGLLRIGGYDAGGAGVSVGGLFVGNDGYGTFTQNSGTTTMTGNLQVGTGSSGNGTLILNDGTINVNTAELGQLTEVFVGRDEDSSGWISQYGGTLDASTSAVYIGDYGSGYYEMKFAPGTSPVLNAKGLVVGEHTGIGYLEMTNGTISTGEFSLGRQVDSDGELYMSGYFGGSPVVNADYLRVGGEGYGLFAQEASTVNTNSLIVGESAGSYGYYYLYGYDAVLNVNGADPIFIGNGGSGEFDQYNGIFNAPSSYMVIGSQPGARGYYLMDDEGGTTPALYVSGLIVGDGSDYGQFDQYGGQVSTGDFALGVLPESQGSYYLGQGGQLSVTGYESWVGQSGTGIFVQDDPTSLAHFTNSLNIGCGPGSGEYQLFSGTLNVGQNEVIGVNGTFKQEGGENIAGQVQNNGRYDYYGGTINAPFENNGSFKSYSSVTFTRTFVNNGAYHSDPAFNTFADLYVGDAGYLTGGPGDKFGFTGGMYSASTSGLWETSLSEMVFLGGLPHELGLVNGTSSCLWGTLRLDFSRIDLAGTSLPFNLYVTDLIVPNGGSLATIGSGINVYFTNLWALDDSGALVKYGGELPDNVRATPEPVSSCLFLLGGAALVMIRRKKG